MLLTGACSAHDRVLLRRVCPLLSAHSTQNHSGCRRYFITEQELAFLERSDNPSGLLTLAKIQGAAGQYAAAVDTLRKGLAPAKKDGSSLLSLLYNRLARATMIAGPWQVSEVEALLQQAREAQNVCRSWLPKRMWTLLRAERKSMAILLEKYTQPGMQDRIPPSSANAAIKTAMYQAKSRHTCVGCKGMFEKMFSCSRCKDVRYCSATCQRAHWREHKTTCQAPV